MPAETHSHRDPLEISNVLELLWVVLGQPGEAPDADASLSDLGVDTDLALLDLFDVAGEEFGERSLAEVDVEDLQTLRTLGDMAGAVIRWTTAAEGPDLP